MAGDKFHNLIQAAKIKARSRFDEYYRQYKYHRQPELRLLIHLSSLVSLLLVVAGLVLLFRPYYRYCMERRDTRLARTYLEQGDWHNAELRAGYALQRNTNNLLACWVMARLTAQAHSPQELFWQQRIATLAPTVENRLRLADSALRWQNPPSPLATQLLGELAAAATTNAEYHTLAARLALSTHRLDEVEGHFATAVELDPTNTSYRLNLAVFQLGMTNQAKHDAANAALENLRTDPALGAIALRNLVANRLAQKDLAGADRYSGELQLLPEVTLPDQLQRLGILQELKSGDFLERLADLELAATTNGTMLVELSAWMRANHLLAENLLWLKSLPAKLREQVPVLLELAEDYQADSQWQALRDTVSQGKWDELEFLRFALISRACHQLQLAQLARDNWDVAVSEAGSRLGALQKLLELANHWDLKPEQLSLLQRIVRSFPQETGAVQALTSLYCRNGNTPAIYQLYSQLTTLYPTNADYQNNFIATALLLQTNLPLAKQRAAAAYARTPEQPQVASFYAYAQHLQHQDAAGLAALKKLPATELEKASPALYYGLLLTANGQAAAAQPWLARAKAQEAQLLPEERRLLASLLPAAQPATP